MPQSNSTLIYPASYPASSGRQSILAVIALSLLLLTSPIVLAEGSTNSEITNNQTANQTTNNAIEDVTPTTAASTDSEASALERSGLPPQQNHMSTLAAALDPSEVVWLAEDEQRFISLYRPALQPAQMAVILMPDSIHKLAKQSLMRELYTELPLTDWSTLHISLPEVTESSLEENEILAAARIATSINFLFSKNIRSTALIAENLSAQRAITASINQADATSGLVLWRVEDNQLSQPQLTALAQSQITVLDVVDHGISAAEKNNRKRKFYLAGFTKNYRLITSPKGTAGITHTQRRVRDWLEKRFRKN